MQTAGLRLPTRWKFWKQLQTRWRSQFPNPNSTGKFRSTEELLVQSEKMTIIGQLTAEVAREINTPINFIYGRLIHLNDYIKDLLKIIRLYREQYPEPGPRIAKKMETCDLDFISEELPQILNFLKIGADGIRQIVLALRKFSLPDEANKEHANVNERIDNILLLLAHRLEQKILVVEEYTGRFIVVSIAHNGSTIPREIQHRIFDQFGHTKSFKKFTGLELSVCY